MSPARVLAALSSLRLARTFRQTENTQRVFTHQHLARVWPQLKFGNFCNRAFRINHRPIGAEQNLLLAISIEIVNELRWPVLGCVGVDFDEEISCFQAIAIISSTQGTPM